MLEVSGSTGLTPRRRLNFLTSPTGTHYTDCDIPVNNFLQEISNGLFDRHPEPRITRKNKGGWIKISNAEFDVDGNLAEVVF